MRSKRVLDPGHDRLSVYGIVRDFTEDEIRHIIGLLLARELLVKNGTKYPTLAVTRAGWTFLRDRQTLTLPLPTPESETVPAREPRTLEFDQALFDKLRDLRKSIASERGLPPYMVFGDATLQQMAFYIPQSRDSFARINGVGTVKLDGFGEAFLTIIRQHARLFGLTEREIPGRRSERKRRVSRRDSTYEETKRLFLQGLPIDEMAKRRDRSLGTIIYHLERLIGAGEELDIDHLMPLPDRFATIETAFQESGSLELRPALELLGEDYSYVELRLVRMHVEGQRRATRGRKS